MFFSSFARLNVLGFVTGIALLAAPAAYADLPQPKIAVVDVQGVLKQSKAAKAIKEQMDAQVGKYQDEMAAEEKRLRGTEAELKKQQSILKEEEIIARRRDLQAQANGVQQEVADRKKLLESAYNRAMKEVLNQIRDIVSDLAKTHNVNLIVSRLDTVYVDPALDLTDEVVTQLDKQLPMVTVEFTAPPATKPTKKK